MSAPLVVLAFALALLNHGALPEALPLLVLAAVLSVLLLVVVGELLRRMGELRVARERVRAVAMTERRKVERDLHDGAQQQFLAVLATLAQSDFATEAQLRELVRDARAHLAEAVVELRRLARGLRPALLEEGGLGAALPLLCRSAPGRVSLSLDPDVVGHRLAEDVESAVYLVVAEALANVTRYADASSASVTVVAVGPCLSVTVGDDGNGEARFTPDGGLTGLRERVDVLGGHVDLHRDPCAAHPESRGSRLSVSLPATPAAASW
jgi:signal transduction histidine kinase